MYLNEATLLNNVRVRYSKDHIYVRALLSFFFSCITPPAPPFHSLSLHMLQTITTKADTITTETEMKPILVSLGWRYQVVKQDGKVTQGQKVRL